MHPDELGTGPQAGIIGPIRREIVFEPLAEPVVPSERPLPEPTPPEAPAQPVEPVSVPS